MAMVMKTIQANMAAPVDAVHPKHMGLDLRKRQRRGSENQNRGERRTRTQEPFGLRDVSWQCLYRFARGTQSTFQRLQQRPALGPFYLGGGGKISTRAALFVDLAELLLQFGD